MEISEDSYRAKVDFGLAISIFLGTLWFYGFEHIVNLTANEPAESVLMFFAGSHGLIFFLFAYSLLLLIDTGQSLFNRPLISRAIYSTFHDVWPLCIIYIFISFTAFKLVLITETILTTATIATFIILSILLVLLGRSRKFNRMVFLGSTSLLGIIISIIHCVIMSVIFPTVTISTDKPVYKTHEEIIVRVTPIGYLFNPIINKIKVGGKILETKSTG